MTTTYQTVNSIGSGTRFTYTASGDNYFVLEGVTVASTTSRGIYGTQGDQSLRIDGSVYGTGTSTAVLTGGDNTLTIGSSGIVASAADNYFNSAIYQDGGNNYLSNHGQISNPEGMGVLTFSGSNEVLNYGIVEGASGVFMVSFSGGDSLINTGSISANDSNGGAAGSVSYQYNNGVYSDGSDTVVTNTATGIISATYAEGAGVAIADFSDGSSISNSGTITSNQWYGVDFFHLSASNEASLSNFGTISGGTGSFRGGSEGDLVMNDGLMIGNIELGDGMDTYDGMASGEVIGRIYGGAGNDSLFGSSADDDLRGGNQADVIEGNGGDDALLGGQGQDVLRGGAGNDRLHGELNGDTLNGGAGLDFLSGGLANDKFIFERGNDVDIIKDFADNGVEKVDVSDYSVADANAAIAGAYQVGGQVRLDFGSGDMLVFLNMFVADLDASDFIFA